MKSLIIFLILPFFGSCNNSNQAKEASLANFFPNTQNVDEIKDSLFKNKFNKNLDISDIKQKKFQDKIDSVVAIGFKSGDFKSIEEKLNLESIKDTKLDKNYWKSYLLYQASIMYIQKKDTKKSEDCIVKAIQLLSKAKSSEDYALLAACKSFSIQFANMMTVASVSQEVQDNAKKSLQLNSKNLRAYEVLCSNNFYTPTMFGGMKKVEEYALKGLACPITMEEDNYYAPRWGKELLYGYMIQYLEKQDNKKAEVDKYKALFNLEFPDEKKENK